MKEFEEHKHRLKNETMDTMHREFLDIYNGADIESTESLKRHLQRLYSHTVNHFAEEEQMMEEIDYPNKREHTNEHKKVLSEMEYFLKMEPTLFGRNMLRGYYSQILPDWFDRHLLSMDSDLVSYLTKAKGVLNAD